MARIDKGLEKARLPWRHRGQTRPDFAIEPSESQESVSDYPRPPIVVADGRKILVRHGETVIAGTASARRILEKASPPTFYIPPEHIRTELLQRARGESPCEWKGAAKYWSVRIGDHLSPSRCESRI